METKSHWKKSLNKDYLGSHDLSYFDEKTKKEAHADKVLTIDRVASEQSKGLKENGLFNIVYFKEVGAKPMLLNSTNGKMISKLAESPFIEDWGGLRITLYSTKVFAFGADHDALRIRPTLAIKKRPNLVPGGDKWAKAIEAVKGGMSFEGMAKHYTITKENYKLLQLEGKTDEKTETKSKPKTGGKNSK